jgi:hypothetical protein
LGGFFVAQKALSQQSQKEYSQMGTQKSAALPKNEERQRIAPAFGVTTPPPRRSPLPPDLHSVPYNEADLELIAKRRAEYDEELRRKLNRI